MPRTRGPQPLAGYLVAVAAVGLVIAARLALSPAGGSRLPFATFYPALVVAAWYGGLGPSVLALCLGAILTLGVFVSTSSVLGLGGLLGFGLDLLVGAALIAFGHAGRAALRRCREEADARERAELELATEKNVAEGRLRRNEQELADFFENAAVAIHWVGPDGTILRVNRAELDLLGYDREEFVGRHIAEFHADRDVIEDILEKLQAGQTLRSCEARLRCKDGSIKYVYIHSNVLREDGRFIHTRCVTLDVTDRRLAQERLRESENRFARFMQHLPGLAWIKDREGRYVYANDAAERAFRTPREGLYGRTDEEVFPPETAAQFRKNDRRALTSGGVVQVVETLEHEGGAVHHSLVSKFPIPDSDGAPALVGGMAVDITDLKRTEEALRRSEEQFHTLADSIPQLAWMTGPDGHNFWYNKRWYDYTGTTPEQVEGWGWQSVHDPVELPRVLAVWKAALDDGKPWEDTFPLRRYDGAMRWHLSRAIPVRDEQGQVVRWFGTNTDITDRMEMEEVLKDADRRKDEFLATLAHELRNPLAPIRNALHLMGRVEGDIRGVEADRAMAERQVAHLARLIDDLMDIARISRGKIELRKEAVDLAAVIQRAVESARSSLEERGHSLTVTLPDAPVRLEADQTRLEQVFWNLLNNAAKYTDPAGQIRLTAERSGDEVVVRVRDTGIGIEPEMLSKVFEMFVQAGRRSDRSQGGLGIGLSLVKTLVEMHGGGIEAHSEGPGTGSEFVIRLPVLTGPAEERAGPEREAPRRPDQVRPGLRLLVVDDNVDAARSLARLLTRLHGQDVRIAHDGPSALAEAEAFRPEIILLDIGLPGMDGYEVARRLRCLPEFARTFIVAMTGWGQEEDRRRSHEAGFDRHLVKPVDPEDFERLLAENGDRG